MIFPATTRTLIRFSLSTLLTLAALCAQAGTYTWDGDSNANWGVGNNWTSNSAPASGGGHDLVFAGSVNTTTSANGGGWTINSLSFNSGAGAFTSGGGTLTIGAGGITNNSTATQTINNQITLSANQSWNAASGAIVSTGYFDANSKNLTLTGSSAITVSGQINSAATLTLSGSGNRTFGSSVAATTVNVQNTGTNSFNGQLSATTINVSAGTSTFANAQAGSGGINISGAANATFTGPVAGGSGSGITLSGSGAIEFSGSITGGTLNLTSAFTGTATLSGTGGKNISSTVVSGGTLVMNQSGGDDAINGSLTVNNGGTVIFGQDNQVPSWQTVTLNTGSTLLLGNTEQTFQNLVITGNSIIDFGGVDSQLNLTSNLTISSGVTLTILNWNTAAGDVFAASNPVTGVTIQYADSSGTVYATGSWSGGAIRPVPEPATYGFILLGGSAAFVLCRRRRR